MEQFFQFALPTHMMVLLIIWFCVKVVLPYLAESTKKTLRAAQMVEPIKAQSIQKVTIQLQKQSVKRRRSIGEHYRNYGRKSAIRSSFTKKDT